MNSLIKFLKDIGKLKRIKRQGWVLKGIKNPESDADHSFRLAVMAMVLADDFKVNKLKFMEMALIHDMAEYGVGDTTPHDNISKKLQRTKERKAYQKLFKNIKNKEHYLKLLREYEENKTSEAELIHQLDCLEMVLQALEYEKEGYRNLDEFWQYAQERIKNRKVISFFKKLVKERNAK